VGSGIPEDCKVDTVSVSQQVGMEGADCVDSEIEEQAVLLVDDETGVTTVVQPNEDGSYWRKIVRNKMIRMKEKRRMQAAKAFAADEFKGSEDMEGRVVSSWGPYTSIVGTAVKTGVAGLTAKAELTARAGWDQMVPDDRLQNMAEMGKGLQTAFNDIDKDGSGAIMADELAVAYKKVKPGASDKEVADMVALADKDGDGMVTLEEFVMLMLFEQAAQPSR